MGARNIQMNSTRTFCFWIGCLFAAGGSISPAETVEKVTADNHNLWLNYVGDHPVGKGPWGLHLELQNRRSDWGGDWQQVLVRPGINYQFSPAIRFSAGYCYVHTFPNGEYPIAADFPEHRAWEQVLHKFQFLDLDFQQRLRLEHRWIGEVGLDRNGDSELLDWRAENRFRYMLRTDIPLTEDRKLYLALWDEVFFNFGGNVKGNTFDQNRVFFGLGRKITDATRLEVGYMEQTIQRRGGLIQDNDHTIAVWLMSSEALRQP
jgi:hypothetical protein